MAKQLLGKEVTAALNEKIKANVAELQGKGVTPTLCIIRVGENPSDISYERGATKRCETLGAISIGSFHFLYYFSHLFSQILDPFKNSFP